MLWIINAFSFSILNIWQSGCEVPWANFSTSTGGLWHLEHLRKESKSVHWCTKRISLSPKKNPTPQILKNLSSLHKRICEHWFSALILQKTMKRWHFLLKSIIRDILLVCFLINFKLFVEEKLRTSLWNISLRQLGSVYCTKSMHILIMLARISLVGWGFSWQDECYRGSQIISSFLITICWKNREFMQVLQLMGKTPKLSPERFLCTCIPEAFHFYPLLHLLWCLFHCLILIQTFCCLPWAACSKLPFNGLETVVPSALQMRWMSIQEL